MRKNKCEVIRQQLDELMLQEAFGPEVAAHLEECAGCREFHRTQTKLRRMVGGLGTVAAPPDFDFRLRARLANESNTTFHLTSAYWPFARRTFAVAAALIVFATGVMVVRNVMNRQSTDGAVATDQGNQQLPAVVETPVGNVDKIEEPTPPVAESKPLRTNSDRSTGPRTRRSLSVVDFSSERAEVISGFDAVETPGATAIFPIDASLQSLKLSLDDGHGNARTISVPTIRFGSQRMLPGGNQFAQKGVW